MVTIQDVNSKVLGGFSWDSVVNGLGWLFAGILLIAGLGGYYWYWTTKKQFSKKITVFEIVGSHYTPVYKDVAKVVKLGKGGFEILFLRKAKTWKVAYGGRIGKDTYYFFIGKDGYWYNGMLSASISQISKDGGLIPIVTTNPTMRAQYTALEKQIDALHGEKVKFWDKYGNWILSIAFILIIGVLAWMIYKEMHGTMSAITGVADQMTKLTEQLNKLTVNIATNQNNGLVPA